MLAVVFGAERFWMYVYGRSFTIESDHKPLESISQKNLADTPAHLQHMLLHLQGYDYTIHYHLSKEVALPDTLSQFSPCPGPDIPLDIAIQHAWLSPERKEALQQVFVSDPEIHALADMIITGWPNDMKVVPQSLDQLFSACTSFPAIYISIFLQFKVHGIYLLEHGGYVSVLNKWKCFKLHLCYKSIMTASHSS